MSVFGYEKMGSNALVYLDEIILILSCMEIFHRLHFIPLRPPFLRKHKNKESPRQNPSFKSVFLTVFQQNHLTLTQTVLSQTPCSWHMRTTLCVVGASPITCILRTRKRKEKEPSFPDCLADKSVWG